MTQTVSEPVAPPDRRRDHVVVLDVGGRGTGAEGLQPLYDRVRSSLDAGHRRIVINLREPTRCDPGSVAILIRCLALVEAHDGRVVLVDARSSVSRLLAAMGVRGEFVIATHEVSAIEILRGA